MENKKKKKKKPSYIVKSCGGKKGKGCSWAGATIGITKLNIAA